MNRKKNILIFGSNGQLGLCLKKTFDLKFKSKFNVYFLNKTDLNISKKSSFILKKNNFFPLDLIINCAAYTNVDRAENEKNICYNTNVNGTKNVCDFAKMTGAFLIHISSDYVYGGETTNLITETNTTNPKNYYGFTKLMSEKIIIKSGLPSIILRCGWLYSFYKNNFLNKLINISKTNTKIQVVSDEFGSPTNCFDLSYSILNLINSGKIQYIHRPTIFNYSNIGFISRYDFAKKIFSIFNPSISINQISSSDLNNLVKRPKYINLSKDKFMNKFNMYIPKWEESLYKLLNEKS